MVFSFRFPHIGLYSDESIAIFEAGGYRQEKVRDATGVGVF